MTSDQNQSPHVSINTFIAIEGGIEALTAFQITEMEDMNEEATAYGWLGNEVYRSQDNTSLIVLTRFQSAEAMEDWAQTRRFRRHIGNLEPLIQNGTSIPLTFVAAHGDPHMTDGSKPLS